MSPESQTAPSTSTGLLRRVKDHDPDAWQRLADLYSPVVYRWARRTGLQPEDAAEAVQEVFLAVAKGIGAFRRDRPADSFRGWLWTITKNKIHDQHRRRGARPAALGGSDFQQLVQQLPDSPPDGETQSAAISEPVHRALEPVRNEFEERTWQAFYRTAVESRCPADVGRELGMSVGAVFMAKSRVLKRLREELSGLMDEE
jgi:RNA polymerase sigma-70 factor (ECF subfamily)